MKLRKQKGKIPCFGLVNAFECQRKQDLHFLRQNVICFFKKCKFVMIICE